MSKPSSDRDRRIPDTIVETPSAAAPLPVSPVPAASGAAPEPPALAPPDPGPAVPFGRYVLLEPIGEGGMGEVFRARDNELGREVALKQIRGMDAGKPEVVARALREARLAARLRHSHIVTVYDAGIVEGRPYITMEYVRGRTFGQALAERAEAKRLGSSAALASWRDEVRVLADVAAAVAYAHGEGVIHRDLKPGNVLLDRDGRALVTDFGLAKEVSAEEGSASATPRREDAVTVSGQVMGTPAYMSPEQVDADAAKIGPSCDIWALGVMLYEALTGVLPFGGAKAISVLWAVTREEPRAPRARNRNVPTELEAVCLKALRKEPERRYRCARDLEEDLRRWLRGESVLARAEGWGERGIRWARRRKALAVSGCVALVAAAAAAVLGVQAWSAGRARAEAERREGETRERMRAKLRHEAGIYLDATLTLRRMGARAADVRHFLPGLQAAVAEAQQEAPDWPEPDYTLGRMCRAVMDFPAARAAQDRALAKDPKFVPALYERAILLAVAVRERLANVRSDWLAAEGRRLADRGMLDRAGLGGNKMRSLPWDDELAAADAEARALRERLMADLEQLGVRLAGGTHPELRAGRLECARGLCLAYAPAEPGDLQRAEELLRAAIAADPTLEEAYEVVAAARWANGDHAGAIEVFTRGAEIDRGYVPFAMGLGRMRASWGLSQANRGGDPATLYAAAIADFDRALALDPDDAEPWARRGAVRGDWGTYQMGRGGDPSECYAAAIDDYGKALELDPTVARTWAHRGTARGNWGGFRMRRGQDAGDLFTAAIADYGKALELDPADAGSWRMRGSTRVNWGNFAWMRGEDPREIYAAAVADFDKALELNPADARTWIRRGSARVNAGNYERSRGQDPGASLAAAIADYGKALELNATAADAWRNRGTARLNWGDHLWRLGQDPSGHYAAAIADYDRALQLDPASAETWTNRGNLRAHCGLLRMHRGDDPAEMFTLAIDDLGKALALNPANAVAWRNRGNARANWGDLQMRRGEDPGGMFSDAISDYGKALELSPADAEIWAMRGGARLSAGAYRLDRGEDPGVPIDAAIADFDKSLEINPAAAGAWDGRGKARFNAGKYEMLQGRDPTTLFRAALSDLEQSLRLNPSQPQVERDLAEMRAAAAEASRRIHVPTWQAALARAQTATQSGDYSTAVACYLDALRSFDRHVAGLTPADREQFLAGAGTRELRILSHYNLGCLHALASAGLARSNAPAREIPPAEAARLRDQAFQELRESVRFGWTNVQRLQGDRDLEPLHADPRWDELVRELESQQK